MHTAKVLIMVSLAGFYHLGFRHGFTINVLFCNVFFCLFFLLNKNINVMLLPLVFLQ